MTEAQFVKACFDLRAWNITRLVEARRRIQAGESANAVYESLLAPLRST